VATTRELEQVIRVAVSDRCGVSVAAVVCSGGVSDRCGLSIGGRTGRYQEAAERTQQRDDAGAEESDAIAGHRAPVGRRRERNQKCDPDGRPYLSGRVEYAGSRAAIGRFRGIGSGLSRCDCRGAEAGAHQSKGSQQLDHWQTAIRQGEQQRDAESNAGEAHQQGAASAKPPKQTWSCQ
jgi:hypothetical protein